VANNKKAKSSIEAWGQARRLKRGKKGNSRDHPLKKFCSKWSKKKRGERISLGRGLRGVQSRRKKKTTTFRVFSKGQE